MRNQTRFRLYFNNQPADRDLLDRVETITVRQEVGIAWEAQLEIPICVDRRGRWNHPDQPFMNQSCRVRVEISTGGERFQPLIEGTVVDIDSKYRYEPGQSSVTVNVRDDSHFLTQQEGHYGSDDDSRSDYEIVDELFRATGHINSTEIDEDLRETSQDSPPFIANGTPMQLLALIAEGYDAYAYVLPGDEPGTSIGVCRPLPDTSSLPDEYLPVMVMMGSDANISDLELNHDFRRPFTAHGTTVAIADRSLVSTEGDYRDAPLLGDQSSLGDEGVTASQLLRPNPFSERNRDTRAAARARRSSYAITASGSIRPGCYRGVLTPYRLVSVRAGDTPMSGDYVVKSVVHHLGRSQYGQEFTLMRNGLTRVDGQIRSVAEEEVS